MVIVKPEQFPLRLTAMPNANEPVYDTASILAAFGGNSMNTICIHPELFSGEQIVAVEKSGGVPRWLLYVAIGLAVVVMVCALAATVRKGEGDKE